MVISKHGRTRVSGTEAEILADMEILLLHIAAVLDKDVGELGCHIVNTAMKAYNNAEELVNAELKTEGK